MFRRLKLITIIIKIIILKYYYPNIYKLLGDTPARFVNRLDVLMGVSDGIERERECEAAHRAGAGVARLEIVSWGEGGRRLTG